MILAFPRDSSSESKCPTYAFACLDIKAAAKIGVRIDISSVSGDGFRWKGKFYECLKIQM